MARILTSTKRNECLITDNLSDSELLLYYQMPTTKERQNFNNMSHQRKGKKYKNNSVEARMKYGKRILTGFRTGDFVIPKDDKLVPISSDPENAHYVENWKDLIEEYAPDTIEALAYKVFESSVELTDPEDEEGTIDDMTVDKPKGKKEDIDQD